MQTNFIPKDKTILEHKYVVYMNVLSIYLKSLLADGIKNSLNFNIACQT